MKQAPSFQNARTARSLREERLAAESMPLDVQIDFVKFAAIAKIARPGACEAIRTRPEIRRLVHPRL
jgi:hypothetical protein